MLAAVAWQGLALSCCLLVHESLKMQVFGTESYDTSTSHELFSELKPGRLSYRNRGPTTSFPCSNASARCPRESRTLKVHVVAAHRLLHSC
jgi:hypothetical protein